MHNEIIKVSGLTKDYGSGKGIFGFDFSVRKSEVFGIVGTNGSGKSTTMRHLMVCIALAAVCFMFSGIFSSSKYAIGLSGAFIGVNILANMLAMFGNLGVSGLDKFKYLTIVSFYDYQSVLFSGSDWIQKMIFPAAIALAAFTLGQLVFRKKDLPL